MTKKDKRSSSEKWIEGIDKRINEITQQIDKSKDELNKIEEEILHFKLFNSYERDSSGLASKRATENAIKTRIQSLELELEKLNTLKKIGYAPSSKLIELASAKQDTDQRIADAKGKLESAKRLEMRIKESVSKAQLKVDVASQFGSDESAIKELEQLREQHKQAKEDVERQEKMYNVLLAASDRQNEVCRTNTATPGYQINKLHSEVTEETKQFVEDIQAEWQAALANTDEIYNSLKAAYEKLGHIKAKILLRNKELQNAEISTIDLADRLEPLSALIISDSTLDFKYKLGCIFNNAAAIGK